MWRHTTIRAGSALILFGLVAGGVQIVLRLLNGSWPRFNLAYLWDSIGGEHHRASYSGGAQVASWLLEQPLSLCVVAVGLLLWLVGIVLWDAFARG